MDTDPAVVTGRVPRRAPSSEPKLAARGALLPTALPRVRLKKQPFFERARTAHVMDARFAVKCSKGLWASPCFRSYEAARRVGP